MNNNYKNHNEKTTIKQLRQTVQSGSLSQFVFCGFLDFQRQRGEAQWNNSKTRNPSQGKKLG